MPRGSSAGASPSSSAHTIVPEGASAEDHTLSISEPALYCKRGEVVGGVGPLNLRASWLAGAPVQGDVLLSLCGLLYGQVRGAGVGCVVLSCYALCKCQLHSALLALPALLPAEFGS